MRRARPIWPLSRASLPSPPSRTARMGRLRWAPTSPSLAESRPAPFANRLCCRSRNSSSRLCATPSSPTAISLELTDGLGTTLGAAYEARAHYLDRERFTSISKAVAERDRLCQLDIADRIRTPANISSPMARRTAKSRFPTRPWPSSTTSTARPIPLVSAYGRPGGTPGADALREFPSVSDRTYGPADRGLGLLQCSGRQRRL